MAKKQLKTQMRKLRTREVVNKRREGKTTDRLVLELTNKRQPSYKNSYDDFDEWDHDGMFN